MLIKNMAKSYLKGVKNKRWKNNTLQFSKERELSCFNLEKNIIKKEYNIKPSLCFISFSPIKREIFAGDFRDRIIHHLIFNELSPYYENFFINDSYSCRKNRGTSYGIKRVDSFMKSVSNNYKKPSYVLKLDIKGYFMNIKQDILYKQNKEIIKKLFRNDINKKNELLYLIRKIIFNNPTNNCKIRGSKSDWKDLPKDKSLFFQPIHRGLPIGNLTSQLFANLYLNQLDHFIKEKLKCHYYGRYVDDMIFFHRDKNFLKQIILIIDSYLEKNLGLKLHKKKIYLQEIHKGVVFLGAMIKPGRVYIANRTKINFYKSLKNANKEDKDYSIKKINSYLGIIKKYKSFKLRKKYLDSSVGKNALKILNCEVNSDYSKIEKSKRPF